MKSSESDVVSARWSVIGTKVYRDDILFAKCANWPNAIAIRDALSCHNDLLEACKGELEALEIWIRAANIPDDVFDGMQISKDKIRAAITRATTQKEGTK